MADEATTTGVGGEQGASRDRSVRFAVPLMVDQRMLLGTTRRRFGLWCMRTGIRLRSGRFQITARSSTATFIRCIVVTVEQEKVETHWKPLQSRGWRR